MIRFPIALVLSILSGVALWLGQAPLELWPLGLVGVGLLWLSVAHHRFLSGACLGWVSGLVYFFLLFDWAQIASGLLLARLALALAQALFFALVGGLWAWLSRMSTSRRLLSRANLVVMLGAAPLVWIAVEQLRSDLPFGGMPWGLLGFGLVDSPLMGFAPLGSTQLVAFVGVGSALLFVSGCRAWGRSIGSAVASLALALSLVILPGLLPMGGKPDGRVAIAVVQGGTPSEQELAAASSRPIAVTRKHLEATRTLQGEHIDVVLWPESASDHDIRTNNEALRLVVEAAQAVGAPIALGTQEYVDGGRYNDYLVVYPDGTITDPYSKQHPVPFGEYIPYREVFRAITPVVDEVSTDMFASDQPAMVDVFAAGESLRLATPICFEVAYSSIIAEGVAGGGRMIVVPTNNASFGNSGEPYQQFAMTRFRAVEHGRTAVQVSTTGTSGVIDRNGVVRYSSDLGQSDARVMSVSLYSDLTLATMTAEYRYVVTYVAAVVCLGILGYRRRR